jgi:ribonucleoside-diphosphate reductase beta chain
VREELNDAFVQLFDTALVEAARRLIADPRDVEAKVDFVTTYHMVIEGTLALTGHHFITKYWEDNELMPGFVEGFNKVARDEHRHVAYGTWYLKQACEHDDRLADRLRAKLMELLPIANGVLVPRGKDPNEEWEMLGYTSAEINEFAFDALTRRLKAIGVPLTTEPVAA